MQGILKFTVLPFRLTARAWADETFREDLLRNPRLFLLGHSTHFPRDCNYVIPVDTASLKHFTVPFVSPEAIDALGGKLMSLLEDEMGDSPPFECWLPLKVLYGALTDPKYLAQLNSRAVSFLRGEGYVAPRDICVLQNSPTTFHIPLRYNGTMTNDFAKSLHSIRGDKAVISTSSCCAGGTRC